MEGKHLHWSLLSFRSPVLHSSPSRRAISIRPSLKLPSGFPPTHVIKFQNVNMVFKTRQDLGFDLLDGSFLSSYHLVFQFLKTSSCLGCFMCSSLYMENFTSASFSSLGPQLKCQLFLTTTVNQPSQTPSNTKLFDLLTDFFTHIF